MVSAKFNTHSRIPAQDLSQLLLASFLFESMLIPAKHPSVVIFQLLASFRRMLRKLLQKPFTAYHAPLINSCVCDVAAPPVIAKPLHIAIFQRNLMQQTTRSAKASTTTTDTILKFCSLIAQCFTTKVAKISHP